jgi:hypothetical protein
VGVFCDAIQPPKAPDDETPLPHEVGHTYRAPGAVAPSSLKTAGEWQDHILYHLLNEGV